MKLKIIFALLLLMMGEFRLQGQSFDDSSLQKIQPYLYENPDRAIELAKQLIQKETDVDKEINYYLFLSKAYTAKRNSDESYKALLKAQSLLEDSQNIDSKINVLIFIAIQYQQMDLFSKSFEILNEVDDLCKKLDSQHAELKNTALGKSYAIKGMIYKSQSNYEIALDKFSTAIRYMQKAKQTTPTTNNISIVYYNIGYCEVGRKNYKAAHNFFSQSLSYAKKAKAQSLEAFALKGLAENKALQNDDESAILDLKKAEKMSANIGDLLLNEGIYKTLAETYLRMGRFNEYQLYNSKYQKVQFQREQADLKSINSLLNHLDENNTEEKESLDQLYWWISAMVILIGVSISGIIFYQARKKTLKNHKTQKAIQALISK